MNALQEEITQKTLALCVETGKITAQLLQQAMKKVLADMEKHKNDPQIHHGKQTIRQLMKHGAGVSNIEITDQNIKAFSATAKKYDIEGVLRNPHIGDEGSHLDGQVFSASTAVSPCASHRSQRSQRRSRSRLRPTPATQ